MEDNNNNRWRSINPGRKAVWTCKPEIEEDVVNSKILSVFDDIKSFPLERIIIQFWRPVKTRLLSCVGNPYAVSLVNHRLCKYRSCCSKYYYGIDDMFTKDPMIINAAPPSTAFLSGFPEVVSDLRIHRGTPLVDLALECELTCFMMMPVFYQSSCVGVIEVSTTLPARLALIFNDLKRQLKKLDFTIRPPDASLQRVDFTPDAPLQAVTNDLHPLLAEIKKAISFQSHAITLCQVWMPFVNYCLGTRYPRMLLRRLDAFVTTDDDPVKLFYDDLDVLPFKMGEGLIGRALVAQRPHLCRNIHKWSDNRGVLALLSANAKCTSFVICLRSSYTRELDYVFEFFWPSKHNHFALIEKLLLTLKEHLPSFKHDSGVRLGDELLVVDVDDSSLGSGSGGTLVKIFPKNKLSEPMGMKRKSTNGEVDEGGDNDDDDDYLVILALYKVDHSLFFMPSSTTFKGFMKKVYQEFELNPAGTYKMEYQVLPGEWFSLTNDKSLKKCISSYQTLENIDHIKLCVQEAVEK